MKNFLCTASVFLGTLLMVNAQTEIPSEKLDGESERPNQIANIYIGTGIERLMDRSFSNRLQNLGKTPLPQNFMINGFGFNVQSEKWTFIKIEAFAARRNDIGDNPDWIENFSFSTLKAGIGYNLLSPTSQFRLEPSIALILGSGRYQLQSQTFTSTFEQAIGDPELNELTISQPNYGLNLSISMGLNPFLSDDGTASVINFELGSNLMLLHSRMRPALANSPNLDVTSLYLRMTLNMITW